MTEDNNETTFEDLANLCMKLDIKCDSRNLMNPIVWNELNEFLAKMFVNVYRPTNSKLNAGFALNCASHDFIPTNHLCISCGQLGHKK